VNPKGEMKGTCYFQEQFSDQTCKVVLRVHLMPPHSGACATAQTNNYNVAFWHLNQYKLTFIHLFSVTSFVFDGKFDTDN
jgi:hypothetical protein